MPNYSHLATTKLNFKAIKDRVNAAKLLGAKYDFDLGETESVARKQAEEVAGVLVQQGGPANKQDMQIIALIAYLQRLGTDISRPDAPAAPAPTPAPATAAVSAELTSSLAGTEPAHKE